MIKLVGTTTPSFNDIQDLSEQDRNLLTTVGKECRINDRLLIPSPNRDEQDAELHRFKILLGEIDAGNDSDGLVKELKKLIVKMSNDNRLPKHQVREILLDLTSLGY